MDKLFRVNNTRLSKYLYSLGFDKKSDFVNGKETWLYKYSDELETALNFFFIMRKQIKK